MKNEVPSVLDNATPVMPSLEPAQAHSPARARGTSTIRVGVIGYGYWGPNIVRNFHGIEDCEVVAVCDKNPDALKRAQRAYPSIERTTDFQAVLTSPHIDAIAV